MLHPVDGRHTEGAHLHQVVVGVLSYLTNTVHSLKQVVDVVQTLPPVLSKEVWRGLLSASRWGLVEFLITADPDAHTGPCQEQTF